MRLPAFRTISLAGVLLALLGSAGPATAQMDSREAIALQNQLLELRRDLQALRDQAGRGGAYPPAPQYGGGSFLGNRGAPPPSGSLGGGDLGAQLLDRVSALEEQVRALRGRIDEIGNQTQQQGQDFAKQLGDLNFRMQAVESGRGGLAAPPPVSAVPNAGGPASGPSAARAPSRPAASGEGGQPPRRPELALQEGNAALARRDYVAAETAAREVLANSRTSPRAYDAQFLLAEALAGRRDWSQAAVAFDDAYNRSRTGQHAPDSLIGLANSLIAIGDKRAGCAALNKLRAEFPDTRPDLRDPIAASRQRAGCS
jgi:TolA-binding protein